MVIAPMERRSGDRIIIDQAIDHTQPVQPIPVMHIYIAIYVCTHRHVDTQDSDNTDTQAHYIHAIVENLSNVLPPLLRQNHRRHRRCQGRSPTKLLYAATQSETTHRGNHVVVLRSPIAYSSSTVFLTVYTWGNGKFRIPQGGVLSEADFLNDLYGYVAGKPY